MEAEGVILETTKEIAITRMDCPTCVVTLEKSVMKVKGVTSARGNYLKKTLKVTFDDSTQLVDIEKAIEDVGYQVAYKKYLNPLSRFRSLFRHENSRALTSITDDDFSEKVLRSSNIIAVLFSSESCPSCQILKPKLNKLAERLKGRVDFYEMDVAYSETWKNYQVIGLPTVITFLDGKPVERYGAMLNLSELEKSLQ